MCLKYCRNQLVNAWVDSWMAEFMDNAWVNKWLDGTIFIKNPCFTYILAAFMYGILLIWKDRSYSLLLQMKKLKLTKVST